MKALYKALAGIIICIILGASFVIITEPSLGILPSTDVSFVTIDYGGGYGYGDRDNYAIRDNATWTNLWLNLYSGHSQIPEVPTVDFSKELLIAVFQGICYSAGYLTNITRISMTIAYYIVYVDELHPGEDCATATVITYPYQIVKISNQPLNLLIRFVYNISVYNCE